MTQLEDNLAAADLQLTAEEVTKLNDVSSPGMIYPNWFTARVQDPVVTAALQK